MPDDVREIKQRLKDDFPHYAERCLKIRTKSGELLPLRLNSVQQYVHGRLEAQRAETGKVRALVLKGRQEGVSTLIGGRFYHRVTHQRGCQVFILTHEQDATNNLFGMVERFHKHNKQLVKPETGLANAKELYFPALDSGYSVGTAGSKAVGRSKTVQLFHGSEVAFWPNASEHFAGVVQTVPDLPGTEMVLESTANGIGGEFHERWQQAEAGIGDYLPIFTPWFWSDEYQRPPPVGFALNEEEEEYARLFGLTLQQMVWRRAKLAELKDANLFRQEYPATAAEAFQATGHDAFITANDPQAVIRARKRSIEPMGRLVVGMDPAGQGNDTTAVCWRQGGKALKVERRQKLGAVDKANWVKAIIDRDQPAKLFIDVGGGYGEFIQVVRDWGEPYNKIVEAVNFGGAPQDPPRIGEGGQMLPGARNRRAEMWLRMRDWLEDELGADIPDDDALHADLMAPGYKHDVRQFLVLEAKADIKRRGLRSPDGADALALTFATPVSGRSSAAADERWRRKRRTLAGLWGR
jgi:hypothetical protein